MKLIDELTAAEITEIEKRMRPDKSSTVGFLDTEQRLEEVIRKDTETLERLSITHQQVADRLDSLVGQAFYHWELATREGEGYHEAQKNGALIDSHRVFAVGWMGSQECPFSAKRYGACGYGSHDFTVVNTHSEKKIRFPQLMPHLVREHHFFEGNTPYRLDPADAVSVMELQPGADYAPKTRKEIEWSRGSSTSNPNEDILDSRKIMRNAARITLASGVEFYLNGEQAVVIATADKMLFEEYPIVANARVNFYRKELYRGKYIMDKVERTHIVG